MSDTSLDSSFLDDVPPSVDQPALIAQARDLIVDGERDKALDLVRSVLNVNMENIDALYLYATLSADTEKSIRALRKLLQVDPQNEKANALLERLHKKSLFSDSPSETKLKNSQEVQPSGQQEHLMRQMIAQQNALLEEQRRQPVININNSNAPVNTVGVNVGAGVAVVERNQTAFVVGLLVGIFLGTFGIAHIMTGRVGAGIGQMLLGWFLWGFIALTLIGLSAGLGACLVLPIHIALAYGSANSGAKVRAVRMY